MNDPAHSIGVMPDWLALRDRTAFAQQVEDWGFDSIAIPEIRDPDPFVVSALVLNANSRLHVGTSVAQIGPRSATSLAIGAASAAAIAPAGSFSGSVCRPR